MIPYVMVMLLIWGCGNVTSVTVIVAAPAVEGVVAMLAVYVLSLIV